MAIAEIRLGGPQLCILTTSTTLYPYSPCCICADTTSETETAQPFCFSRKCQINWYVWSRHVGLLSIDCSGCGAQSEGGHALLVYSHNHSRIYAWDAQSKYPVGSQYLIATLACPPPGLTDTIMYRIQGSFLSFRQRYFFYIPGDTSLLDQRC